MNRPVDHEFFTNFISTKRIVIADANASSAVAVANMILGMGAQKANIFIAASYEAAQKEIELHKPQVVITDYNLGSRCGLDLLQSQRESNPNMTKALFAIVTENSSQSAVAQAAEEDVDTYILKPYTAEVFRKTMLRAALSKADPSPYEQIIEQGKSYLAMSKFDEAMPFFRRALDMNPKPTLACYYVGQAHAGKKQLDPAQSSYDRGLSYNKIHYKCMNGLCEVLMAKEMHAEAYDMVKRIARYYPANQKRLATVLRLAIITKNYEDIERYYQVFKSLDDKNDVLIRYVCAALVVCGKYYLQNNLSSRAVELFKKASATASGRSKVLREIILSLTADKYFKEAEEFLNQFGGEARSEPDFKAMDFLVREHSLPPTLSIEKGTALLEQGIQDPAIYRVLIQRCGEAGMREKAQELIRTALERFPELREVFRQS